MSANSPIALDARMIAILKQHRVAPDFGALEAIGMMRSQPYHWIGLAILNARPGLWLGAVAYMVFAGWITHDLMAYSGMGGGEHWWLLAPGLQAVSWLPIKNALALGLLASVPYFVLGNYLLVLACGGIAGRTPGGKSVLAGLLGAVPLRFFAGYYMPSWKFWGGEWRGVMSINARILQFSAIYAWVHDASREEVEEKWVDALQSRFREVVDSYYSYVYIAPLVICAVLAAVVYLVAPLMGGSGWLDFQGVFIFYGVWVGLTRYLLGVMTFALLHDPNFEAQEGNRWLRLVGMASLCLAITAAIQIFCD